MRLPSPPGATSSWRCRRQGRRWVQADTRCSWRVPSASLFQLRIQHRGFIWACTGLSTVAGPPNATLHDHSTCRLHIPLPAACPLSCHAEHRCAGGGVARRPHPAPAPRRHRRCAAAQLCGVCVCACGSWEGSAPTAVEDSIAHCLLAARGPAQVAGAAALCSWRQPPQQWQSSVPAGQQPLLPLPHLLLLPAYCPLSCLLPAGSVIRDHGLIEIQPDAPAPSGDGLPTAAAFDATSTSGNGNDASSSLLVNVNNRLVSRCLPLIPLAALHPSTGLPPFLPHFSELPAPLHPLPLPLSSGARRNAAVGWRLCGALPRPSPHLVACLPGPVLSPACLLAGRRTAACHPAVHTAKCMPATVVHHPPASNCPKHCPQPGRSYPHFMIAIRFLALVRFSSTQRHCCCECSAASP